MGLWSIKPLASFFCSANTILNVLNKPSEQVLLNLMYTNCVPILTYACEVKSYTSREMMRFDVALNDCIRKIFTFNRWESTRELRRSFGYDSISEIYAKRQRNFFSCLRLTGNPVLIKLRSLTLSETNQWYWLNYYSFPRIFFPLLLFPLNDERMYCRKFCWRINNMYKNFWLEV